MKTITITCALFAVLAVGCATKKDEQHAVLPSSQYEYVIDVQPNIALHRAFNADGKTYLEFLDARRMNPVVTGPDGVPMPYAWSQNFVVLNGVYDNLTVTTPHGVAHVYVRTAPPPARVAAPTPSRALEYGAAVTVAQQKQPDNYEGDEVPPTGDAVAPERITVPYTDSFARSVSVGQADELVAAARGATHITISVSVPRSPGAESRAANSLSEARQFLIDNGVSEKTIYTKRVVSRAADTKAVEFLIVR